jgi:hypothetical protein
MKIAVLIILLSTTIFSAQVPHTFSANTTAKASEVNDDFSFILAQIDTLKTQNLSLKSRCDSIAILKSKCDSLSSTCRSLKLLSDTLCPLGSIIASMTAPGGDGYLPNSNQSWLLAAGQGSVNGVTIPDLRGVFLRGIDYTVTGRAATGRDSLRVAGDFQVDAFQGHWHQGWSQQAGSGASKSESAVGSVDPGTIDKSHYSGGIAADLWPDDKGHGTPRSASETRPKNAAVYYYIKVK